jgi:hypothetical protein
MGFTADLTRELRKNRQGILSRESKKDVFCWVPVAHACNSATWEAEIRRFLFEACPGK